MSKQEQDKAGIAPGSTSKLDRRELLRSGAALVGGTAAASLLPSFARAVAVAQRTIAVEWVATTQNSPWQNRSEAVINASAENTDMEVLLDQPQQTIEGFGGCFNELGWDALNSLEPADRQGVLREIFAPGVGANFNLCRMPLGANDFSRDWYSYDETAGDFDLKHFSIANDQHTLVPFIEGARHYNQDLRLWASPWSPPAWMKRNQHYAAAMSYPGTPPNGLKPEQVGKEGTDMFIQEDKYFRTYAAYFSRFIEAYKQLGIRIGMVMPQNEFNSAQPFPSCTWTPEGLAKFIRVLGPQMQKHDVDVFFGTMERADEKLFDTVMADPVASKFIKGVGLQWAGKGAIAGLHRRYPGMTLYQSEQECGDGKNGWKYCVYTWSLMRHYMENGANAYMYWNIALKRGGVSRWGWAQNSLVSVDPDFKTFRYNYEYYLLKHMSHFVAPGAKRLPLASKDSNALAFANPDQSVAILIRNDEASSKGLRLKFGEKMLTAWLEADSFNTFLLKGN